MVVTRPFWENTGVLARVHQHEAAGAVRIFGLAGGKAGLAEERRLLVAGRPCDLDAVAKVHGVGLTRKQQLEGMGSGSIHLGMSKLFQRSPRPTAGCGC